MAEEVKQDEAPPQVRVATTTELLRARMRTYFLGLEELAPFLLEDVGDYARLTPPQGSTMSVKCTAKYNLDTRGCLQQWFSTDEPVEFLPVRLERGEFHPRIWRNGIAPNHLLSGDVASICADDFDEARNRAVAFHLLQRKLVDVLEVVTPRSSNASVDGPAIQQVLAVAAMEVEALLRDAYRLNSASSQRSDVRDWHKLVEPMRLHEWEADLPYFPEWQGVRPFGDWAANRPPTWWTANNKLKHEPQKRQMANLGAAIAATSAVRILLEAQFGPRVQDLVPAGGIAEIRITRSPTWSADEVYFPPLPGTKLRAVPVFP